jgi:hypothetical protein
MSTLIILLIAVVVSIILEIADGWKSLEIYSELFGSIRLIKTLVH